MAALTTIGLGLAIAGMVGQSVGQVKEGNARKRAADSEADRAEDNAQFADGLADDAIARGLDEEGQIREAGRVMIGAQRAGYAGQGVRVDAGSAAQVAADTHRTVQLDALTRRNNAAREAFGYRFEAQDLRNGADVTRRGGRAAQTAGRLGAATSLIGGGSSLLLNRVGFSDRGTVAGGRSQLFASSGRYTGPSLLMGV